jgi:transcriptional regulator with XRE-family HTH domain
MSQAALAGLLHWTQQRLSRRLTGLVAFNLDELDAIAAALGVAPEQLVEVDDKAGASP